MKAMWVAGALWVAPVTVVMAQEQAAPSAAMPLSIEEALRLAERASENVTVARAGVQRADAQAVQARADWLPQLSGNITYDRTIHSEFEDVFSAGAGGGGGAGALSELPFGQANTWRAGLSLTQNLYAGGRTTANLQMAHAGQRTAEWGLQSARAGVMLEVAQAYYDAVLADRLLAISEATLKQAEDTFAQIKLGAQQGTRPEFDLLRAQVTFENQRPAVLQSRINRDLALLRLKQLLDLPLDRELQLTSELQEGALTDLGPTAQQLSDVPKQSDEPRVPVRQAQAAVEVREAGVRAAFSQHLPTVNVVSSYGWVAYPDELLPSFKPTPAGAIPEWRNNWTVGLQILVPLFSGFRTQGQVQAAEADAIEARARLQQAQEQAQLDTRSAEDQLSSAQALWEASAGTVAQAQRAYQIAELRYREGISTQLELSDARILLEQAEANRARAARDLQVARIRVALLPYLPLGAATTSSAAMGGR